MSDTWGSYPKVYALGHRAIKDIFLDDVVVEEKVDGSQFSMGRFGGELRVRSRGQEFVPEAAQKIFKEAVETAAALDLHDGWTYRGEVLSKPKHNVLAYDRVPKNNIILFDVTVGIQDYLGYEDLVKEAARIGLECVPLLYSGKVASLEQVLHLMETVSILGGQKIEGLVFKNHGRFSIDGKPMFGKYVSEAFKEIHRSDWKNDNPNPKDIKQRLIELFKTEARWNKAIQHLSESGELKNSPEDIGNLIKECQNDIKEECSDNIKEMLYTWAIKDVLRGCTSGLPEWYKKKLLNLQFENNEQQEG